MTAMDQLVLDGGDDFITGEHLGPAPDRRADRMVTLPFRL
jgi:hypothetical protein